MRRAHEELFGVLFSIAFPMVMGFVVAVSFYVDGVGSKSLLILATWLAASCFLWAIPSVLQRFGGRREVMRDERGVLNLANSALIAHAVTWLFFLTACVVVCWNAGAQGTIPVNVLPLMLVGGIVIFQIVLVLSGIIQERTRLWPITS
jgi:hypothetical protein